MSEKDNMRQILHQLIDSLASLENMKSEEEKDGVILDLIKTIMDLEIKL